ncbi:hypothetical protein P9305_18390 [Lysinibacillus capsici]|uniref:hypothetical protein n=1 Tax=Lysinibacillus capsici TaxID=2115968 RepID=UPI0028E9952F|nr:hypothetical protein [Lysinibacillus capsici]MED4554686.1 hypothetical protein [Lysinibacillus capsici]
MKDQSISIEQMQEIAKNLHVKGSTVSYVPDVDQLIVTIRETNNKVIKLKSMSQLMVELTLIEDLNYFALVIHLELDSEENKIVGALEVNDNVLGYLEKVANGDNSIQVNVIGEDINLISARHFFESELAKTAVRRELNKVKDKN